jgi:hypothetical protein
MTVWLWTEFHPQSLLVTSYDSLAQDGADKYHLARTVGTIDYTAQPAWACPNPFSGCQAFTYINPIDVEVTAKMATPAGLAADWHNLHDKETDWTPVDSAFWYESMADASTCCGHMSCSTIPRRPARPW